MKVGDTVELIVGNPAFVGKRGIISRITDKDVVLFTDDKLTMILPHAHLKVIISA